MNMHHMHVENNTCTTGKRNACAQLPQAVDHEDGTDLDPSNTQAGGPSGAGGPPGGFRGPVSDHPPELGSIQRASIRSIKPYGVFVQMDGFQSNALVHLSQAPIARSAAWSPLVYVHVTCCLLTQAV